MVGAGRLSGVATEIRLRTVVLILCGLALCAYLPALFAGFVFDDPRFVENNEAIRTLTPASVVSCFTDPRTLADVGWKGIYRPLRTLDFAIDYNLGGGTPFVFHFRNILYHAFAAVLVFLVLLELLGQTKGARRGALFGSIFFVLHPVHTEVVAWITSRGDLLLIVFFLFALLMHMRGRTIPASVFLVLALFSKESAVVFVGAAVLVDLLRRARLRFGWYALYTALAIGYVGVWKLVMSSYDAGGMAHLENWWGGSYGGNLLVMSQGFMLYVKELVLPIDFVIDYHIPALGHATTGSTVSILVLCLVGIGAIVAGRRSQFALAFFLVTLFPTSNLLIKVGIPTAERFLYLPSVGLCFLAAPWLARTRLAFAVFACFFLLTFARSLDWRTSQILWDATNARAATPRGLSSRISTELDAAIAAREALKGAMPSEARAHYKSMVDHALNVIRRADELLDLYENQIRMKPGLYGSAALSRKANALMILERPKEALEAADRALRLSPDPEDADPSAWFNAALALQGLGEYADAAANLEKAREVDYDGAGDLTPAIAAMWVKAAKAQEDSGDRAKALSFYRRSWDNFPDPSRNRRAQEGIERLSR